MTGRFARQAALAIGVAAFLVWTLFPVYWALLSSFERGAALFQVSYWPAAFDWGNYRAVFAEQPFGRNILNSVLVAGMTVALSLVLALFAAYALGRVRFRGRTLLLYCILAVTMLPQVSVLSGMFELITMLGLYDRLPALVFAYQLFSLPFTVWVLTTFLREIPAEIEQAALVDGANPLGVIRHILLPLVLPGLVTAGLLAFIAAWNEFLFALTFTLTDNARTVPVAIALISGASQYELPWGEIMAASVIVTVPIVALAVIFQRRIVSGLTAGALRR